MPQYIRADRLDILWGYETPPLQKCKCLRGDIEVNGCPCGCTILNQPLEVVQFVLCRIAGCENYVENILFYLLIHINIIYYSACTHYIVGRYYGIHRCLLPCRGHLLHYPVLFVSGGVGDLQLEHEAVHLCLGQRISAFLFYRVLCGEDQKRFFKDICLIAYCDLSFLHRLKQGALHLGRGAVYLIGKDDVRKYRPLFNRKGAV